MGTVYKDSLIEITDDELVFRRYYFPFGRAKRVPMGDVESIRVRQPSFLGGSWRLWGSGDLRTWFPRDFARPSRDRIFLASLRGRYIRIGFTVEDSAKVMQILQERGLLPRTPST